MNNPTPLSNTSRQIQFVIPGNKAVRLLLGCIFLLLLTCGAQAKPVEWEYRVINATLGNRQLEALLNSNGSQGWELVQINERGVAIFKRRK